MATDVRAIPWLRISIEGVVIVASILLAFALEAMWSERQERQGQVALVELLRSDVQRSIFDMRDINARADSLLGQFDILLPVMQGATPMPPADSLLALVQVGWTAANFTPSLAAYEVARGSQAWTGLPDQVKVELARYLEGKPAADEELAGRAMAAVTELVGEYGGLMPFLSRETTGTDYSGLVRSESFQSWMFVHWFTLRNDRRWRAEWIERLEAVDGVLAAF